MNVTVGSLFDGIGGTPLSTILAGGIPVWASEVDSNAISISSFHFPFMKHLGDVTELNGMELEPVDIVVGGSPCQDLSIAGSREGLEGQQSSLFREQIRILEEMRNGTNKGPKYFVWENVVGAFSSNSGNDFHEVLQSIARIVDRTTSIPRPPKGKWTTSGSVMGESFSIAWRTLDAQYWGVPQRRRRIYLVADFRGHTAPEILFKPESLQGDFREVKETEETATADTRGSVKETVCYDMTHACDVIRECGDRTPTLQRRMGTGGNQVPLVLSTVCRMAAFGEYEVDGTFSTMKQRDYKDATDLIVKDELVRRLTPLECERLQGYPDNWTKYGSDGKELSDSNRYRLLGNSFAIPNSFFVINRCIRKCKEATT